jgi:hypothetical protein
MALMKALCGPGIFSIDPRSRRRAARPSTTRGARKGEERERPLRGSTAAAGSERDVRPEERLIPGESGAAFLQYVVSGVHDG